MFNNLVTMVWMLTSLGALTMSYLALVVEDEVSLHLIFKIVLENMGFEVIFAEDGQAAMNYLQQYTPEVIFLDMLLPLTNGEKVLEFIRRSPDLYHIPIIIVTAHNRFNHSPYLLPQDQFLLKPVRPDELRQAVEQLLAKS